MPSPERPPRLKQDRRSSGASKDEAEQRAARARTRPENAKSRRSRCCVCPIESLHGSPVLARKIVRSALRGKGVGIRGRAAISLPPPCGRGPRGASLLGRKARRRVVVGSRPTRRAKSRAPPRQGEGWSSLRRSGKPSRPGHRLSSLCDVHRLRSISCRCGGAWARRGTADRDRRPAGPRRSARRAPPYRSGRRRPGRSRSATATWRTIRRPPP